MKNEKSLAIDTKFSELRLAEKFSNMIRFVFGNRTFSLHILQRAINNSFGTLTPLLTKFNLHTSDYSYTEEDLKRSVEDLKILNESYNFLTVTKIDALLAEAQKLNRLNDRALNDSLLFRDWEVKIDDLPLSSRIKNALRHKQIFTINDLSDYGFSEKNILAIRNIGPLSLDELRRVIEPYGLILK